MPGIWANFWQSSPVTLPRSERFLVMSPVTVQTPARDRGLIPVRAVVLFLSVILVVSCDNPRKLAMRELADAGVEISGRSLLRAVADGNAAQASLLLEAGVFTGQRDAGGRTALGVAVAGRDPEMVKRLINGQSDVNAELPGGGSILGLAAEAGDPRVIGMLLAAGARADGLMPDGDLILPWAIRRGRQDLVSMMMAGESDPHMKDRLGNPLLHVAMEAGRRDLMEILIRHGADPGGTNAAGEGTIQLAIRHAWLDSIPSLASAGADPNAATAGGDTLLETALGDGNLDLAKLLLRAGADPGVHGIRRTASPLETAFSMPGPENLEMLLENAVVIPQGGWEPWLVKAVDGRDLAKARLLLARRVRFSRQPDAGLRQLESVVLAGHGDFVKLMADYGEALDHSLELACARGDCRIAGILLASGAAANGTLFPSKDTLLSQAVRSGHDALAAELLRHGANPGLAVPEEQSLFHLAVAKGCAETVSILLDSGTDPDAPFSRPVSPAFIRHFKPGAMRWMLKMERNPTPLMAAADNGHIHTARHLIRAGARVNARTRSPAMWPLNFAANRQDVPMMRLMLGCDPFSEDRIIEINLPNQEAVVFDSEGNEILKTRVSTGRRGFATPPGEYVITNKHRNWTSTLYHANMPYFQRLSCGDFGLHQGVVPGYPASHGCIRVPAGTASKLFSMTRTGDRVRIYK
jgi:ankyrin repeat protein